MFEIITSQITPLLRVPYFTFRNAFSFVMPVRLSTRPSSAYKRLMLGRWNFARMCVFTRSTSAEIIDEKSFFWGTSHRRKIGLFFFRVDPIVWRIIR